MDQPGGVAPRVDPAPSHVAASDVVVSMRDIHKAFYGVAANEAVDLELRRGEVHALLGENGAGKTTLCSILAGLYRADRGEIVIDGQPRSFHSPRDALGAGVGMVYQHFRLVDTFTVAENLTLGHPATSFRLSAQQLEDETRQLCERYGIDVDPRARIWGLSVGEQQRVEILRLLHRGVHVLILDEPTAVLTPQETHALFRAVRAMCEQGKTVVFVSHKLREVIEVSDRITVLRGGKRVGHMPTPEADPGRLARLMVGRDLPATDRRDDGEAGPVVLTVEDLHVRSAQGHQAVNGVGFDIRSGEIVGIVGVAGNGQRELAEALAGLRRVERGRITLNGRDITPATTRERIRHGIAFVPEDRLGMGVAAGLPLEDNLVLKAYRSGRFSRGPFISGRAVRSWAAELSARFDIRGAQPGLPVSLLSGGNLQRAILARELAERPTVLIAASPTRGLDIAAIESVRRLLLEQRADGTAVLLISEDLEELRQLSDRTLVIYEGAIMGEVLPEEFDLGRVGLMMAGTPAPEVPEVP